MQTCILVPSGLLSCQLNFWVVFRGIQTIGESKAQAARSRSYAMHVMRENVFPCSRLTQEGGVFVLIYAGYTYCFILVIFIQCSSLSLLITEQLHKRQNFQEERVGRPTSKYFFILWRGKLSSSYMRQRKNLNLSHLLSERIQKCQSMNCWFKVVR